MALTVDKHERQLILLLQKDGRMSNVEMAAALGVTEGTVRRKMAKLLHEGTIKVAAVANPFAIGFAAPAIISLKATAGRATEVADRVSKLPGIRFVALTTGTYDIIVEGYFRDNADLSRFLLEDLSKVDGIVESQASLVLRLIKQSYDWGVPVEGKDPPEG